MIHTTKRLNDTSRTRGSAPARPSKPGSALVVGCALAFAAGCTIDGQLLFEIAFADGVGEPPDCELESCEGRCVDMQSDSEHCGQCGHDCLDAPCTAGVCEPVTLAEGGFSELAIASPFLYFIASGTSDSIVRLSTAGGTPELFATPVTSPMSSRLVADAEHLYVTLTITPFRTEVWRLPLSGGGFSEAEGGLLLGELPDTGTISIPAILALNATELVVLEAQPTPSRLERHIFRFDQQGATPGEIVARVGPVLSRGFALDEYNAYVAQGLDNFAIVRLPLAGGEPTPLGPERQEFVFDLDVTGDSLVFAAPTHVSRLPTAGGESTTLAVIGAEGARHVLADAEHTYYFTPANSCDDGSRLYRVPLAGGEPVLLAHEPRPGCVADVVADADALYWTSRGADAVQIRKAGKR